MPEELAIALVVLAAIGWIVYKVFQVIAEVTRNANIQLTQAIANRRDRLHQKKRSKYDSHVRIVLPPDLKEAEIRLKEIESSFRQSCKGSSWMPKRPLWNKLDFSRLNLPAQRPASKQLNISDLHSILHPDLLEWLAQEQELLSRPCSYPAPFSREIPLQFKTFAIPALSIEPVLFEVTPGAVTDKEVAKYFENERRAVEAYSNQRDHLLAWYRNLTAAIATWNRDENRRWEEYRSRCEAINREEALYNAQSKRYELESAQQRAEILHALEGAVGKTVKSIQHNKDDEEGVWTLLVGFTDDTMFVFDIDARPRVRANYMTDDGSDPRSLRPRKTVCDW